HPDQERDPRAVDQSAQAGAAALVGAEHVGGRIGGLQALQDVLLVGAVGRQALREDRGDQDDAEGDGGEPEREVAAHQAASVRMRGSSAAEARSTNRLTATKISETTRTTPCTTGKSRLKIASTTSRPMPGHAKMVSVTTAPPRSWANCSPSRVTIGIAAFLSACPASTRTSLTPLARAVRT